MTGSIEKQGIVPVILEKNVFLVASPIAGDGGHEIGRLPHEIPLSEYRKLGVVESAIKAIRAKCIDCSGGNATEARKCVAYNCALWPFRMGKSPFWGKSEDVVGDEK